MPKYAVTFIREVKQSCVVQIDAANKADAQIKADKLLDIESDDPWEAITHGFVVEDEEEDMEIDDIREV